MTTSYSDDFAAWGGLSDAQAAQRLQAEGYNEIPSARRRPWWLLAWNVIREPMLLLLVACGVIYMCLGDRHGAMMLLGFVFVVIGITFYQERKTERALEALRDLSSPRANVIRGGRKERIPGREVVRDDLLVLAEGDRVPADGVVVSSTGLHVDEALLTGESAAVRKASAGAETQMARPGGEDSACVFSGTLVVAGQALVLVRRTGSATEMGRIGKSLDEQRDEPTTLQRETAGIVRKLATVGLGLCALVAVLYWYLRGNWIEGLLAGITLAMATLPEEFPMVLTIFLALGAWRLSQKRVLTRRVPAIEMLGAATVLCVDKTGTLTQNRMTVARLWAAGQSLDAQAPRSSVPEHFHALIEFGVLASKRDPFDPMEQALNALGHACLADTEHLHATWKLVREYPLGRELLALSHVWKSPSGSDFAIAAKGAPEAIADLCHLDVPAQKAMESQVVAMANDGLRVLGVAKAAFRREQLPSAQHDFAFRFVGLVGLCDPVRPAVPGAIAECYQAGIRVIMITGDYPGTARHIAAEIGLARPEGAITGAELDAMDDATLQERIGQTDVFARVVPEQKLRIVDALKRRGEIVAMTGDGVNDAPALKAAHIGIAMGGRGTDVAREAADLVLLDDDFSSIVASVRMGRRIYDNIRKATAYILAVHVPIAGLSLIPVLMGWPLILMPVHIVFLELIIDPACSVVFEAESEESDVMRRRPRGRQERLFGWGNIGWSVLQGLSVLAIVVGAFLLGRHLHPGGNEGQSRALAFATLIVCNLGLILSNRSLEGGTLASLRRPNRALWCVLGGAAVTLAAVLYVPWLQRLFKFATPHRDDLLGALAAGVLAIIWFDVVKRLGQRKHRPKGAEYDSPGQRPG